MEKDFDTLVQFGTSFQTKTITTLIKDQKFLEQINDIVEEKYYDSDAQKWLIKVIKEYFQEYKKPPTMEVFKLELKKRVTSEVMEKTIIENLRNVYQNFEATDLQYVQENFLNFAKDQTMKRAIYDAVDMVNVKKYEEARNVIDIALKAGTTRDLGVMYKEEEFFQRRVAETLRSPIPLPWDIVNEIMDGGLGSGELGIVVAPLGIGKSWLLIAIGAFAMSKGKNVIHYTLELDEDYVSLRYDANVSGFGSQDVKFHQDEVFQHVEKLRGNLIVKDFPTKMASIETLRSHINRCKSFGFSPDMIIVDYGDLLKDSSSGYKTNEKRFELDSIFEGLRGFAGEIGVPLWTASQANRSSLEDEHIEAGRVSESLGKLMIADFVISLQRKTKDKIAHTGRIHVIKNRFGPDGFTFPSKMNASNGRIQLFEETSPEGKKTKKSMESGENLQKKQLSEKINELTGGKFSKKVEGMG
jgi:replicative DNA helicase